MNNGNKVPRWSGKAVRAGVVGLLILVALGFFLSRREKVAPQSDEASVAPLTQPAAASPAPQPDHPETEVAATKAASTNPPDAAPAPAPRDPPPRRKRTLPTAFDVRLTREASTGSEVQQVARGELQREIQGVDVEFDPVTSAPKHVMAAGRFLTPARGGAADPAAIVKSFIDSHEALFAHAGTVLQEARLTRDDVTSHSGLITRVWQQELDGVPLYKTVLRANLTQRGELVALGSHFIADPVGASGFAEEERQRILTQPPITVSDAIVRAAAGVGEQVPLDQVRPISDPDRAERRQRFEAAGLSDVSAALSWVPMDAKTLRLAWEVTFMSSMLNQMYEVLVDAQTGDSIVRVLLTADATDASYRVYASSSTFKPFESPTPMLPGTPTPSGVQGTVVPRQLVTLQSVNATASPDGWINDGVTETIGNNVQAHTDIDANNLPDLPRPSAANRVFDFPVDLTLPPSAYRDAAVTHLFYMCNWMHDELYSLGFTESAGNFQTSNFGRGGLGNDAVLADAQDGSGTDNANMSTPSDGSPPRMQMYVFTAPTPDRDGDFDNVIVLHEYTHGLTNRLVGGGVGISALATGGMGEGWSDFYGLAMLSDPASDANATYPGGAYATYLLSGMTTNHYFGIRRYPYTTDLSRNPLTFRDIDPTQARPHIGIPLSPRYTASNDNPSQVHRVGEVWCVTLWECRARLIAKYGPAGNQRILQLVTDALKLSPANPNFLQARDAVIQADLVRTGGADAPELWAAFAKRGMGVSAVAPPSSTTTGVIEASDLPDALQVSPQSLLSASGPAGGPFTPALQTYTLTNSGAGPLNWYVVSSQPWVVATPSAGTLPPGASTNVTAAFSADAFSRAQGTYNGALEFRNVATGGVIARPVRLTVGVLDNFTELFDTTANDTDNQSWLFTPDGSASFYNVTRTSTTTFPTDPTGGTPLSLTLDSFLQVTPSGGASVRLYGVSYPSFFVSTKGYVTMGSGSFVWTESLAEHFSLPRIAALFDDLDPAGGTISWRQLPDRIAVTWQNVTEFATTNSNNFQIEMFFDGRIRITCLGIAATDGLIGLSRGQGTPAGFVESDFSAYGTGVGGGNTLINLALPASVTEGGGVLVGQGAVSLINVQPAPVTVSLLSSNSGKLSVPATVVIPAGQANVTFNLVVPENTTFEGPQNVVISASGPSLNAVARAVAVADNDAGGTFTLSAPASVSESAGTVSVTLGASIAPTAPLLVALASSDTTEVQVPAFALLPAGAISSTFSATIVDDLAIDGSQTALVTASLAGWTPASVSIVVTDNEVPQITLTVPASIAEGASATGTVSASGLVQTALVVNLVSADPARLSVPATVTIPAGSTSANFAIVATNNTLREGSVQVAVNGSASGFGATSATTTILDNDVHNYLIEPIASAQVRGVPFGVTIRARDINGVTISSYTGVASVSASVGGTPVPLSPSSTGAFTAGIWTGNVTLSAFASGVVLSVSDALGNTGTSNAFNVGTGPLQQLAWDGIASPQGANLPFSVTITARDQGGNTVPGFSGTASLSALTFSPSTSTIVITEANHDTPDEIEFMNVSSSPVDVSGWQIFIYDDVALPLPVFTIPSGTVCPAGGIFRLQEAGTAPGAFPVFFTGQNISWTNSGTSRVAVLLRDATGAPVDFMCAAGASPSLISAPQTIPASLWTGAPVGPPTVSTNGYVRTGASDNNSAADWTTASPNMGAQNIGLTVPFLVPQPIPVLPTVTGNFVNGVWTGVVRVLQGADPVRLRAEVGPGIAGESNSFAVVQTIFAQPQVVAVPFGSSASIVLVGMDAENPGAVLTYSITSPPTNGTLGGVPPNVTYTPAAGFFGSDSFSFRVANGTRVSTPATVTLNVTAPPAEISVEQPPGTPLTNGTGVVDFGSTPVGGASLVKAFTIRNVGGQPLTLSGVTDDGPEAAEYSFPTLSSLSIPPGGSAVLPVTLRSTSAGTKSAVLRIASNDADENPFDIAVTGQVTAAPDIVVEQSAGVSLEAGIASVSFADTVLGVGVVQQFVVRNVGTLPLSIGGITTDAGEFSVGPFSQSVLAPGGTAAFAVTFNPASVGAKSATLRIPSNDPDESPFLIRLVGIGSVPPGLLRLARDINTNGANGVGTNGVVMDGVVYFTANTPEAGLELWKTDGTAAGTVLVRDISPGTASSSPGNFRVVGSTLYFTATVPQSGVELWRTDGTTGGTILVRDIFPGASSSSPANLTNVAGTLFFSATDSSTTGVELWKSDGTNAGTVLVADINTSFGTSSSPSNFAALGSTLFFTANTSTAGTELWKSDGTAATTVLVSDIFSGVTSSAPTSLTALNGRVYFSALSSAAGRELWTSDGTAAGTTLVRDIFPGTQSSSPAALTVANSVLFFTAVDANGRELWRSDGTSAGTTMVKDISPASGVPSPVAIIAAVPGIYFAANDGSTGTELWKSDGTSAGTVLVADIDAGPGSSTPTNFAQIGNTLFFSATTALEGVELWKTDLVTGETVRVRNIGPGSAGSFPSTLLNAGGRLFFVANDGVNGTEAWTTDGTAGGTALLRDFLPGSAGSGPANLRVLNGRLVFSATDGVSGTELWSSDGLPGGTALVRDLNLGAGSSFPGAGVVIDSTLFFPATEPTTGTELWRTDGTAAGTTRVLDINPGTASSAPSGLVRVGNTLYFAASDANGTELWKSDGTAAGTVMVANISATGSSSPANLTEFGGMLFFTASDGVTGTELWKSDGTAAGTVLVADIFGGLPSSSPANLRVMSGYLYFSATNAAAGMELWRCDGTNVELVADILPGTTSSAPSSFTLIGSTLCFSASGASTGRELWKTSGTGAVLVRDIATGVTSSSPINLTSVNGLLFFAAFTVGSGTELWRSDGTEAGTQLVREIVAGNGSSSPTSLAEINGILYFSGTTPEMGAELWRSDGTEAGTVLAADIRPGPLSASPSGMTMIGSRLFFSATGPDLGTELWVLELSAPDISLEHPAGIPLTSGSALVNFGTATIGAGGEQTRTFTLRNTAAAGTLTGFFLTTAGAAAGEFSATSPGVVAIPPGGAASFNVVFAPAATGTRSATLRVFSNDPDEAPFDVAVTGSAVAPTSIQSWRLFHFGTVANTGAGADSADFDGDGVINLFEFAFGTDPKNSASGPGVLAINGGLGGGTIASNGQPIALFEPRPNSYEFRAVFIRRKDHLETGLSYTVQFSADLTTWHNNTTAPTVVADDGVHQAVSVPYPYFVGGEKARFFRVLVTTAP